MRYVIGIDEAGRGALAGPVCVGAVLFPEDFPWSEAFALITKRGVPRLRDSKQLNAQQRDVIYDFIVSHGRLKHAFAFVHAHVIDKIGIVNASHEGAAMAIADLEVSPSRAHVLLDAGLKVPKVWSQESIIRGDETVPAIAFASIIAKVTRDRLMEDVALLYDQYKFEDHKGYGTLAHRRAIARAGLSDIHRVTFCSDLRVGRTVA
ncbi:MAG: ribonuclease HII [Candidatus Kaiserbacteria bacterium]|nr:ribonuclease HII [Candidatus Kaiserbacteria bacterium]